MKRALLAAIVFTLPSCSSTIDQQVFIWPQLNREVDAQIGSELVIREYQVDRSLGADHSYREELIYCGGSDSEVKICYREFSNGFNRPAWSKEFTFNLRESPTVSIRGMEIEILRHSSNTMVFRRTGPSPSFLTGD